MSTHTPFFEGLAIIWFAEGLLTTDRQRPTDALGPPLAASVTDAWAAGRLLRDHAGAPSGRRPDRQACLASFVWAIIHAPVARAAPSPPGLAAPLEDYASYFGECLAANTPIDPAIAARLAPPPSRTPVAAAVDHAARPPL